MLEANDVISNDIFVEMAGKIALYEIQQFIVNYSWPFDIKDSVEYKIDNINITIPKFIHQQLITIHEALERKEMNGYQKAIIKLVAALKVAPQNEQLNAYADLFSSLHQPRLWFYSPKMALNQEQMKHFLFQIEYCESEIITR